MRTNSHMRNNTIALAVFCFALVLLSGGLQALLKAQGLGEKQRSSAQIRKSERAAQLLRQAIEHRNNSETTQFLEKLQSARDKFESWLVPVEDVKGLYTGVHARTTDLLQSLSREERATYRQMFEPDARERLEKANARGKLEELSELGDQYPLTPSGQQALKERFIRYFKTGNFEEALRPLRTRFQFLRDSSVKAQTAQKIVLCLSLSGQTHELQKFSERISDDLAKQNVRWADDVIPLSTFLDRRIEDASESVSPSPAAQSRHTWSPLHQTEFPDVPSYKLLPGTVQPLVYYTPSPGASRQFRHTRLSRTRQGIRNVGGMYPSRFKTSILLNNGISAWGWNINRQTDQTQTTPSWTVSPEQIEDSDVMKDVRQLFVGDTSPDGNYFCSLVTGVGATSIPTMNLRVRYPIPWRSLYSINASTGDVNWKHGGRSDSGFYENASFPVGALYRNGVLYAPVVKFQTSNQTPNLYAVAIDAATGELLWHTFITKNMLGTNLFENPTREVIPAAPIIDRERLYITTNTGMTIALDRQNGNPEWLYRYVRRGAVSTRGIYPRRQSTFWQNNLPSMINNTLLVTPTDSLRLLALDSDSGRIVWKQDQFDLSSTLQEFAQWVVPAGNQRFLICSQKALAIFSGTSGQRLSDVYSSPVPIEGRPIVTADYIGLPTSEGISLISYQAQEQSHNLKLTREQRFQPGNQYQPGNLFINDPFLFVAGNEEFILYRLPEN
jgi:outer membrane protein assembly factor BamB